MYQNELFNKKRPIEMALISSTAASSYNDDFNQ